MKRFRTTYIVALVIVAIFVILAEIAVQLGFTASEEDARLINIASRQRALVQKIAKSSVILSQTTNVDTFQIYKKELAESLDLWQKSHQALLKGDLVIGIKSPKNSPATIQRFQDLQPFYEQIQTAAMAIAANDYSLVISDETKKLEIKNNTGIILENEAKYFPIMNEIVDQYEKEAKGRTDTTALIAWSVGIIILGVLVLLAIFYFAPISKKLENFVEEIENKNKKLAASEMELRKISEEQLKLNEDLFIAQKQAQEQNEKLKQAEEETRKALERQERTNQKLLVAQRELQKTLIEQNRINQQLIAAQEEAEKKRKELEKNEQEMRMLAEAQLEANEKLLLAQKQEEKVRQELAITAQKQEALNRILQKSILTNSSNFNEFLEHSIDVLSEIKFLELLPGVGIFLKKEGESEVYEMVRQKNISPKIQELCHNIKTGQCLCGLAIKTKETQYAHCVDERHTIRFEGIKEHGHYNIPILYQEEALGAVVVYLPHGHKREQAEINFLEAVANIIASTYIKVKNEKELQATLEKVARSEQEMRMLAEAQLEANEKLLLAQKQEEKVRQELAITAQKQEALNRILQKSILTNSSNFNEFLEHSIDVLSEIKFLELLPGVGIFLKKEGESEVYEMVRQKNISPKIQELCHNIKTGQCLCGLAIKTKETQYAHCVDERHTIRFEGIEEHGHYNIPILYQEEALGAVVVYLPHGHKREQAEINFLEAVANIIASTYIKVKNEKELQATLEKVARSEQEMRLLAEAQLEANEKLLLAQREAEKSKKELEETLEQQKVITSSLVLAQKEISRRAEELEKAEREMRQLAEAQIEANEKLILAQKIEKERTAKIEKYNAILTNLSTTPFEKYENLEKALQAITEAVAEGLGIERASIWDYTGTSLVSKDLFEKTKNQHSAGLELFAKDFPAYFEGVQSGLAIVAHNAHTHPNTFEFSEVYLKPLGINSMLDVPIRVAGELKGVVCCEYVGTDFKEWTLEDENFARSISEIISLMIEADKRKKAEKELQIAFESLKKSQKEIERLALVASKTDNAIIITDANGFIEWANEGFERLTEYKLEEVKGKKPGSFLQGEKTNPADVFAIRQGIASLKSFYQEIYNYSKSGRGYWLGINITPLFDEQNNLTGFIAIESDITERKQVEIELQNALEKARRAEEDMRALAEAQLEANERLMMAEKQLKETLELEKKQKEELDRLVAQLKETQGQLVHNEKMASLGQLTAGIAHEINNPINFVYNGIDTLKISLDDLMEIVKKYNELDSANGNKEEIIQQAKELKEQLGFEELTQDIEHLVADIKKGAIRTMEIVKGLRIFSRLDEEERKMANIKEALESTLILLNNKMKGRIEVKKYYDETMPEILCYPGQLNQVFMNILNNAIQAIPEDRKDGEITIYTENQAENVIIRIKDNGVGMSEQVKRRIFEPFFTTKPVGVGTGLGLSITFGIIEKHGGQIFVNSEEGKGTEFVIQLPKERI
ncbi:GAF domain-containing protein [Raineya orbicola]|uniref:histidine kinase n=1 Tax=Raineya orbicola TaxID=2016530 RepID=A0A2N3IA46_9BACT|nr:GAF domain-containing protein [Raineya orbicola]PKQ67224.1 PAS domain S-box protein [Raineya orbicola]